MVQVKIVSSTFFCQLITKEQSERQFLKMASATLMQAKIFSQLAQNLIYFK